MFDAPRQIFRSLSHSCCYEQLHLLSHTQMAQKGTHLLERPLYGNMSPRFCEPH